MANNSNSKVPPIGIPQSFSNKKFVNGKMYTKTSTPISRNSMRVTLPDNSVYYQTPTTRHYGYVYSLKKLTDYSVPVKKPVMDLPTLYKTLRADDIDEDYFMNDETKSVYDDYMRYAAEISKSSESDELPSEAAPTQPASAEKSLPPKAGRLRITDVDGTVSYKNFEPKSAISELPSEIAHKQPAETKPNTPKAAPKPAEAKPAPIATGKDFSKLTPEEQVAYRRLKTKHGTDADLALFTKYSDDDLKAFGFGPVSIKAIDEARPAEKPEDTSKTVSPKDEGYQQPRSKQASRRVLFLSRPDYAQYARSGKSAGLELSQDAKYVVFDENNQPRTTKAISRGTVLKDDFAQVVDMSKIPNVQSLLNAGRYEKLPKSVIKGVQQRF